MESAPVSLHNATMGRLQHLSLNSVPEPTPAPAQGASDYVQLLVATRSDLARWQKTLKRPTAQRVSSVQVARLASTAALLIRRSGGGMPKAIQSAMLVVSV